MISTAKVISFDTDPRVYLSTLGEPRGKPDHLISASELRAFMESPSKFLAGAEVPEEEDTESTFWGSLVDCLALQPKQFDQRYAVFPETYPDKKTGEAKPWNGNATFCREWKEAQGEKDVLKREHLDRASAAVKRLLSDARLSEFIGKSARQVFVLGEWKDDDTGLVVPLKGLIDTVPPSDHPEFGKCLGDLKTARDASPQNWGRVCYQRGYHIQAAIYLDLYCVATGEDRCDFRHIVQESMPPYEPGRRFLSAEFIALGRAVYQGALARYCQCLKHQTWPNWDDGAPLIPGWSVAEPAPYMIQQV